MRTRWEMVLTSLGLVMYLCGCAQTTWVRPPGVTEQQANRDWYECQRDATNLNAAYSPLYGTQGRSPTLDSIQAQLGAQAASENLFESCMVSKGFRKVTITAQPSESVTLLAPSKSGPAWLDRQRVLDDSILGKQLKAELRQFVAERQKTIDVAEERLKAMEDNFKAQSPASQADKDALTTTFRTALKDYQEHVKELNAEVDAKKKSRLEEFEATINRAVQQLTTKDLQSQDPNLRVIEILDLQALSKVK